MQAMKDDCSEPSVPCSRQSLGSLACHKQTSAAPKKPGKVSLVLMPCSTFHFLLCTCEHY